MKNCLIGYSGFVGGTLLKQVRFDALYRSNTIHQIENQAFDVVVCAGASAQKWMANRDPVADRNGIDRLISHLETVTCRTFILISTVDVFQNPVAIDEASPVDETNLHPYGLHRRLLEKFVQQKFNNSLVVRLPGLVGPGLRKNVIFDLLNDNNIHNMDSRSIYQFYPMVNLWFDIQTALTASLPLLHLAAEPVSVADVSCQGFGKPFTQILSTEPARYDMQTRYASLFGGEGRYQYSARDTFQAIRSYAQSEPLRLKDDSGVVL
jgi:hypothetical protein